MSKNRGKQFEAVIRKSFEAVPNTSVVRLHDQTTGFAGSTNHCDFIVYHKPFEYHIECKTVHGNTLSIHGNNPRFAYGNITNKQWEGLLEKSKIPGVIAGIICWWVDRDITLFLPIQELELLKAHGNKSIRFDIARVNGITEIFGKKKRVFFEYDMTRFFKEVQF